MIASIKKQSPTFNELAFVQDTTNLAYSIEYKIPANEINPKIHSG